MYTGFDLQLDKNACIFWWSRSYEELLMIGEKHLSDQSAKYERDLEKYVTGKEIDGTKIQNEWFPQIEADIFISHSHADEKLACVLAGWLYINFGLKCFIDSNVWGYAGELLDNMNADLSDRKSYGENGYLYDYQSCNEVSQHANAMLSIALQKMIDKVEAVILLNTDNSIQVYNDSQMNKTYSPWIYSEIICTQIVRKKPLFMYRNYISKRCSFDTLYESTQFIMHNAISYTVSLNHLKPLKENDLSKWEDEYSNNRQHYEYALDALYKFICPDEVINTKNMFAVLKEDELGTLKHAYSAKDMDMKERENAENVLSKIIRRCMPCCVDCDNRGRMFKG